MRRQAVVGRKIQTRMVMKLSSLVTCLELKRMSYAFQLLKQFYLFPEESDSSQRTVSNYDPLIFDDQLLHAMVRKLETKLIENKIWAFINLKTFPYLQKVHNMARKITRLKRRLQNEQQRVSFELIKTYSYRRITTSTSIQITDSPMRPRGRLIDRQERQGEPRSRSGSIIRYEYDTGSARRILLNGEVIGCEIQVRRSVSPMKDPEYIKISSKALPNQDIRYIGLTRQQLQKKENVKYEYQPHSARVICVQRSADENSHLCTHCAPHIPTPSHIATPHSQIATPHSSQIATPHSSQMSPNRKITRLRSNSRIRSNYLEHLG